MRAAGRSITPLADLSRGVVGVVGRSLVVNLPGSPKGAVDRWPRSSPSSNTPWRHWLDRSTTAARRTDPVRAVRPRPVLPARLPDLLGCLRAVLVAIARRLRVFTAARAERAHPFSDMSRRVGGLVEYAFVQTKMFKDPPGRPSCTRASSGVSCC